MTISCKLLNFLLSLRDSRPIHIFSNYRHLNKPNIPWWYLSQSGVYGATDYCQYKSSDNVSLTKLAIAAEYRFLVITDIPISQISLEDNSHVMGHSIGYCTNV